jgi:Ni/Fe-hydrogenase subunit HybB-like protein
VALTSLEKYYNGVYFPSIGELFVTLAVVSAGFWIFSLAVKHLPIFVEAHDEKEMVTLTPSLPPQKETIPSVPAHN